MSNPYYKAMASQFLDLWQSQVSTMMTDKDFVSALLEMLQSKAQNFDIKQATGYAQDATKHWYAPLSSGGNSDALAEFERRLGAIEKRIARLETGQLSPTRSRSNGKASAGNAANARANRSGRRRSPAKSKKPAKGR